MEVLKEEQIEFLYLLAYLYMQQTKFDLALQLFRILRLHTAKNMKIALALASCLQKAKRFEEALKVLSSINNFDESWANTPISNNLIMFLFNFTFDELIMLTP